MKYCVDNRNRGGFQSAKLLGKKCPSTALVRVERACKCMYIIYCVYIYIYILASIDYLQLDSEYLESCRLPTPEVILKTLDVPSRKHLQILLVDPILG